MDNQLTTLELDQTAKSALMMLQASRPFSTQLMLLLAQTDNMKFQVEVRAKLMPDNKPDYLTAVDNGAPIFYLKQCLGLGMIAKIIAAMLARFVGQFNVSKNMTPAQIGDYAITLVEESQELGHQLPAMRLEDFALFFEQAKTGKWGKPFDYIDSALIESWLDQYWKERVTKYRVEKKAQEEWTLAQLHANAPGKIVEVDAAKLFQEELEKMKEPLVTSKSDKEKEDEYKQAKTMQRQRELSQRIKAFAALIASGEELKNPFDIQFYENNKAAIEAELKSVKNELGG